jgi:hypothetical protein
VSGARADILPRHLRSDFLKRLVELLPRDFGDADLWRASHVARREAMAQPWPPRRERRAGEVTEAVKPA